MSFAERAIGCQLSPFILVSINVPLEPPDQQYWRAAVGYVELGMFQDANDQLEKIDPFNRAAPDVIAVNVARLRGSLRSSRVAARGHSTLFSVSTSKLPKFNTFNVNGTGLPFSSQLCSWLALPVKCRCAWACLITFAPGIFAKVSAALRAAADRLIRVSRLSSASVSLRTSAPLRTFADSALGDVAMATTLSC